MGGAEAVLHRSQQTVASEAIALEGEHCIHQVLQHLGAGQQPLLGDMAHQQQGGVLTLGDALQGGGALAHLSHRARCTAQLGVVEGLDAVDDRHGGSQGLELLQHQLQVGFGQQLQAGYGRRRASVLPVRRAGGPGFIPRGATPWPGGRNRSGRDRRQSRGPLRGVGSPLPLLRQPPPAQLHLLGRFLSAHIEHRLADRHGAGALEQEGGLSDAGIAAQQHQGARHEAPAEHPIEFAVAAGQALQGPIPDRGDRLGTPRATRPAGAVWDIGGGHRSTAAAVGGNGGLLHQGVPATAARTATEVLAGTGAAALAHVAGEGASQGWGGRTVYSGCEAELRQTDGRRSRGTTVYEERWRSVNLKALWPFQ